MHASIRRYQIKPGAVAQIGERVNQGFLPLLAQATGFLAYYVVDGGTDVVASISVFNDKAQAEAANQLAADWVQANLADLIVGPAEVTTGFVIAVKTV